jgi:hypothetical protein
MSSLNSSLSLLSSAAVLALLLVGCDATGPADTVILNANSPIPPTVEYTFVYDTEGRQQIGVRSLNADTLGAILQRNGFSRADVRSARVERVVLERRSDPGASAAIAGDAAPKVFEYLTGATLYLGPDASGVQIASTIVDTDNRTLPLTVTTANVTDAVKRGHQPAFLELAAAEGVPSRRDRVRVTVDFRIEVQGV